LLSAIVFGNSGDFPAHGMKVAVDSVICGCPPARALVEAGCASPPPQRMLAVGAE
jgi:hypothetical protein